MIRGMEVETKYRADEIKLTDFFAFCDANKPVNYIMASGWDFFYDSPGVDGFARHRVGSDFNQLTYKRKTTESNNYVRQEDNLNLTQEVAKDQVASFLAKFGYRHNRSIFKNCFIYKFHMHTLVYYVIYSEGLEEVGRFIEIEMSEDYDWESEQQAWDALLSLERSCKTLGLSPKGRMKKSLYELVCE